MTYPSPSIRTPCFFPCKISGVTIFPQKKFIRRKIFLTFRKPDIQIILYIRDLDDHEQMKYKTLIIKGVFQSLDEFVLLASPHSAAKPFYLL